MKGHPKYKVGDRVSFHFDGYVIIGEVCIVDKYGTFEDGSDVSYDIVSKSGNEFAIYKHVREDLVEPIEEQI